ncbi:MAG: type II secretion system protein GspM [Sulfurifustaceae bacterium]
MDDLKKQLEQLADRIDALSVRERGLIFFAVAVVLYLIAYNVVFGPLRAEQAQIAQELRAKRDQIQTLNSQLGAMFPSDGNDANADGRAKIAALTQRIKELDVQMDRMTSGVVTPKEMAKLLEEMLQKGHHLELVKLEALPAVPADADPKAPAATIAGGQTLVYRHGMRVELRGRYFDIVDYLKTVERLPWKVFWGEISLESDTYPLSKVSFVIYTLSRYPGWIGV